MKINKNAVKRVILFIHKLGIHIGIHVLPVHYYSPVPNILELAKTKEIWAKKSQLPGIMPISAKVPTDSSGSPHLISHPGPGMAFFT